MWIIYEIRPGGITKICTHPTSDAARAWVAQNWMDWVDFPLVVLEADGSDEELTQFLEKLEQGCIPPMETMH